MHSTSEIGTEIDASFSYWMGFDKAKAAHCSVVVGAMRVFSKFLVEKSLHD